MEHQRNHIHLMQVCLLLWIGNLVCLNAQTTEDPITGSTDPTGTQNMITDVMETTPVQAEGTQSTDNNTAACHLNYTQPAFPVKTSCPYFCALYRQNSSYFESKCDEHCMHHLCNDSSQNGCTMYCCNSTDCMLSAMNDSSTAMPSTVQKSSAAPTIPTTTTTTLVYSDKKCRSFKCDGADCYKNQATVPTKQCQVGINHCELQKIVRTDGVSYEGGCSNTCSTSTKSCAAITNGNCFQECCNATNAGCCMKLDGQVHFNTAPLVRKGSILKIFACAFFVIFISRFISSSHA